MIVPVRALVYGDSGAGKSTFAATFPQPILAICFDPMGKDTPYQALGHEATEALEYDGNGTPFLRIVSPSGELACRIEWYLDPEPEQPTAYRRFLARIAGSVGPFPGPFATVVIDSITFMELAARHNRQFFLNPTARDPRQWYAGSTEDLESTLMNRLGALPRHVVALAHIDEKMDEVHGRALLNPAAPGRMRKGLPAGYNVFCRAYASLDQGGGLTYLLQTRPDGRWNASNQLGAPSPCAPTYHAITNGGR